MLVCLFVRSFFPTGIEFWGGWRTMLENKFFFCLSCLIFKVLNCKTGNNSYALQRADFQMCHSKLCSSFVWLGTGLGMRFELFIEA